eukprot:scaffold675573_cov102-Prasinocladus_malaysianus.AAC.1
MAEDEGLRVVLLVVVVHVGDGEELLADALGDLVVAVQVGGGDQPVGIHPLRLVQPQPGELDRVVELVRGGHQQALEDVGQMADSELVVEVDGGFAEGGGHL